MADPVPPVVRIGPNEARDVVVLDDSTLTARYMGGGGDPEGEDVTVTTGNGSATAAGAFRHIPHPAPPTISAVTPDSGQGGTVVTIRGSGFGGPTTGAVS